MLEFQYSSRENPDWAFARNLRCTLMTSAAEWVQCVFSCVFDSNGKHFIVPNRDYPYEGLLAYQDGENWKLIDCVAVAVQSLQWQNLPFVENESCPTVQVSPWEVKYHYKTVTQVNGSATELPFNVTYRLHSASPPETVSGHVELSFPNGARAATEGLNWTIQPFLDVRHMYAASDFGQYQIEIIGPERDGWTRVVIGNHNRRLAFCLPPGRVNRLWPPAVINWRYKLGTGSRREESGPGYRATVFQSETKKVVAFFNWESQSLTSAQTVRLFFVSSLHPYPLRLSLPELQKTERDSAERDLREFRRVEESFALSPDCPYRDAILARIMGLLRFKSSIRVDDSGEYVAVPHAGAWWFRTPWSRDLFEGVLSSFRTLTTLPEESKTLRRILLWALASQDERTGLIPTRLPEFKHLPLRHNNSDGTLLCWIAACKYAEFARDRDVANRSVRFAMRALASFCASAPSEPIEGPPRLDAETGLLLCAPQHSWLDTEGRSLEFGGCRMERLPNRLSLRFIKDMWARTTDKDAVAVLLRSSSFFLPEVNAQWITALSATLSVVDHLLPDAVGGGMTQDVRQFRKTACGLLEKARSSFVGAFWNERLGFPYNVVFQEMAPRDEIECEAGVTAVAMLGETVFTREQLAAVWRCTREKLLVHRRLVKYGSEVLPFGILARNEDTRIYYGDGQYHDDVVWLRSTPYLLKLLRLLGEEQTVRDILINTLDHQMTEGAVFYNHELFSRPYGNNPRPDESTCGNPVPVKNPIQYWSQWCDPMLDYFERKEK